MMGLAGWSASDQELEDSGLCRHCFTCFNVRKCSAASACPIVECALGCGWVSHVCKMEEHESSLCPLATVPCINTEFGCGMMVLRRDLATHLPSCPANIITCTQEWNRWPLHCRDRWKTVPFITKNPLAERGQLDYELALRDQKVVGDFYKVPRKTKLAMRNNLTRRYPALPLPPHAARKSNPTDKSLKSLKETVMYEVGDENILDRAVYGVAKLFLKNQEKQSKRWKEDVDSAIARTGQPIPKKYWEYPEHEKGNIHDHCAYCYDLNCEKRNRLLMDDSDEEEDWTQCCQVVECQWRCGASYHHCKAFEHKMICPAYEEEGEFDWMRRQPGMKSFKAKKEKTPPPLKPFPDLLSGSTLCPLVPRVRRGIPPPPPPPPNLGQVMRFDIKMETVTKLQQKPRAMFTFICGQDFRRDQWESHSRNVHSDIHGGLNNWIEARCPLSSYGCGFAVRRVFPGSDPRARIVYSQEITSFGVRPAPVTSLQGGDDATDHGLTLTSLPLELVQLVFTYLDSWSLANLGLVSVRCRELVSGLLDDKGCVALQWERREQETLGTGANTGWVVAYKRWFFSSHFSPVTRWGLGGEGAVTEHLKSCPYNIRTAHTKPDTQSKQWTSFMSALKTRLKDKRNSEWFIE